MNHRWIVTLGWVGGLSALALTTTFALANAPQKRLNRSSRTKQVVLSSGLRSFEGKKLYRLHVVEVRERVTPRKVTLRVRNAKGKILREVEGRVTSDNPFSLEFQRLPPDKSDFLRAEYVIDCDDPFDGGVISTAEVVNLRSRAIEDVATCACPCCPSRSSSSLSTSAGAYVCGDMFSGFTQDTEQ